MENNVIYGDCLNAIKLFEENSVDLYIADPPYWKVINEKWDYQWHTEEEYIEWCKSWLKEIYRTLKGGPR